VVNDTEVGGEDNITELSGGKKVSDDLFVFGDFDVESGGNDTTFINSAKELNDDFASSSVIDDFEVSNVACRKLKITLLLHQFQKLDDDLGAGSDKNLETS
jgi:hypothetical protein